MFSIYTGEIGLEGTERNFQCVIVIENVYELRVLSMLLRRCKKVVEHFGEFTSGGYPLVQVPKREMMFNASVRPGPTYGLILYDSYNMNYTV